MISARTYPISLLMYDGAIVLPTTSIPLSDRADVIAVGVFTFPRGYAVFEAIALCCERIPPRPPRRRSHHERAGEPGPLIR